MRASSPEQPSPHQAGKVSPQRPVRPAGQAARTARPNAGQPSRPAVPATRPSSPAARPVSQGAHQRVRPVDPRVKGPQVPSRSSSQFESARFAGQPPCAGQAPGSRVPRQSPEPPKKGGGVWRVVFWVALLVFVVSAGALAYIGYTYWKGQAAYDEIASEAFVMPENATLADFDVDWEALRQINPDVVGWIYMPGTDINYPIAHRAGDDEYYLYHNFNGASSSEFGAEYGSIMLSGVNTADFSDEVNIIYGHNMNNGTMFAPLSNMEEDWFNTYRTVYLLTPQGNYLLKSFAYVHVPGSSTDIVIPRFDSSSERTAYMQARYDTSLHAADPAGSPAADIERAFALVTCDGANRSYRYITYFEPIDYYALDGGMASGAAGAGEDAGLAGSVVSRDDLSNVGGATEDRAE